MSDFVEQPLVQRHPVVAAVGVAVAWVVFVTIGVLIVRTVAPDADPRLTAFIVLVALSVVIAALVTALGWWHELAFVGVLRNRWVLILPLIVVFAPWLGGFGDVDVSTVALFVVGYALTGFAEETVFRGVLFRLMSGMSVRRIVVISSILFGLVHLGNVLIRGNPAIVAAQAVGAATAGVGYASIYVLTGTIWAPIAIHFLHDLVLNTTALPLIPVDVAQDIILLAYGIYLLWWNRTGRAAPNPVHRDGEVVPSQAAA